MPVLCRSCIRLDLNLTLENKQWRILAVGGTDWLVWDAARICIKHSKVTAGEPDSEYVAHRGCLQAETY